MAPFLQPKILPFYMYVVYVLHTVQYVYPTVFLSMKGFVRGGKLKEPSGQIYHREFVLLGHHHQPKYVLKL
jgi:hypothetical protein